MALFAPRRVLSTAEKLETAAEMVAELGAVLCVAVREVWCCQPWQCAAGGRPGLGFEGLW